VHAVADYRCSAYVGTSIKERLHRTFEVPVIVDNDVNVLAVAEKYFGAGIGTKHLLCLTLGTGIGGAMLIGGKLVHGAWGGAGEFGHISVDFRGETCHCGGVGCVELYASGTGIARRMQLKSGLDSPDTRQVVERWLEGDACATEVMEEAIQALGTALMSLIHAFNPEKIVIGGGLSEIGAPLFARLQEEVTRRTMPVFRESLQIQPAYKLNKGNMIGAAMMILKDDWKE
ncbi:MAG: ROK family protein, partial [Paenibacillaceae bacterium]|nr:ROK family protein [Paenibacillaceae bacterium]